MIYMVDDKAGGYPDELKLSGFNIMSEADVDLALEFFEANHERIDLLILDIMMAPGESFEHERTLAGRRTGIFFYERVRRTAPDMPVIVLTVLAREGLVEKFSKEKLCWLYYKREVLPHELVEEVRRITPHFKAVRRGQ
jgi:DNA-binding NarL/FixJ family response regulator